MPKPEVDIGQSAVISINGDIPGVFAANQKRSVSIRDSFIKVGVEALNDIRLRDLTVADLCNRGGHSVGAFYTRFEDKDAFFRALRVAAIDANDQLAAERFTLELLNGCDARETIEKLVDLLVDIFVGPYRGVLRESFVLILEPDDPWAPMRRSALKLVETMQQHLADAFLDNTVEETNIQCRFCFQLIAGSLQNDLINDYHVFSTKDDSLRGALKQAACAYMGLSNLHYNQSQ